MLKSAGNRLVELAIVMLSVATLVFILLRVVPGDPVLILGGLDTLDREVIDRAREAMGLDRSIVEQYLIWLGNMMVGDFGQSLRSGTPVSQMIAQALPPTLQLGIMALVIGIALSIPLGVAAARRAVRTP